MENKMKLICFFMLISATSQLNIGAYAATYNVGDNLGWTFPPLGAIAYRTWAAKQNFVIGDTLVFNFTTGQHNVAEVSKASYDSCNTQSPILISNNGPANITLNGTGEHYFICAFPGHCDGGMKLAINVSAPTTNTPAPQQPAPVSGPSSSRTPVTLVVGDALGWTFPPLGAIAYRTWAAKQNFVIGDTLVFNFTTGQHNVAEVSKTSYDSCNTQSPISISNNGPANITLNGTGEHYYICTYTGHCNGGMKLAINVSAPTTTNPSPQSPAPVSAPQSPVAPVSAPTPVPVPAPSSRTQSPATSPSRTPAKYVVGGALGWTVPPGGPIAYQTWANDKTFIVGDTLIFNFTTGHTVAQLTSKTAYDSCNLSAASTPITNGPASIILNTTGEHFYFCTIPRHCTLGQKLAINVTGAPSNTANGPSGSSTTAPSSSATSPPSTTANGPSGSSTTPSSSATPPSGSVSPPSPSSASTVVAAIPFALLSIVFTLFY